jgi:alpha-aminoadipic semialdehyde synthase
MTRRYPQNLSTKLLKRGSSLHPQSTRTFAAVAPSSKLTIGVRREDPARIWERRCPLTPLAVESLVHNDNVDVLIQDCDRRVFPIDQYIKVCEILSATRQQARANEFHYRPVQEFIPPSSLRTLSSASRKHH